MYSLPLAAVTVSPLLNVVAPAEKVPSSLRVIVTFPPYAPKSTDAGAGATYVARHSPPCRVSRYTLLLLPVRVSPLASVAPPALNVPSSLRDTERVPPEEPSVTDSGSGATYIARHSLPVTVRCSVRRYWLPEAVVMTPPLSKLSSPAR